jgi:hypothetical protein
VWSKLEIKHDVEANIDLSVLQDLFTFHHDSTCTTHEMLDCKCAGVGLVAHGDLQLERSLSITEDELSSQRDCQLQVAQTLASSTCVRMNQLFQWQHYSQPVRATLLQVSVTKSMACVLLCVCVFGYCMETHQLLISRIATR